MRMCISYSFSLDNRVSYPLMRVVWKTKGSAPTPSEDPSRPSVSTLEDVIKSMLESSTNSRVRAKRQVRI
jgi:hypothetical protein